MKQLTLRLPDKLHNNLKLMCVANCRSIQEVVESLIDIEVTKYEKKKGSR